MTLIVQNKRQPRILNKSKHKIPADAVYVGRPSKYGNPFEIGKHGSRENVIRLFRRHLEEHPELVAAVRRELYGKDLVCWCSPKACHAEVLLEVIYEDTQTNSQ